MNHDGGLEIACDHGECGCGLAEIRSSPSASSPCTRCSIWHRLATFRSMWYTVCTANKQMVNKAWIRAHQQPGSLPLPRQNAKNGLADVLLGSGQVAPALRRVQRSPVQI